MLVSTRKVGQIITLGNPRSSEKAIETLVVNVQGAEVKLGVTAPLEVPVHRREIWEQKKQEERTAEARGEQVNIPDAAGTVFSVDSAAPFRQEEIVSQYLA